MGHAYLRIPIPILCHCQSMQLLKGRRRSLHNGLDPIHVHEPCVFLFLLISYAVT